MKRLNVSTTQRGVFVDITDCVNGIVKSASIEQGACLVFCPHTTAGITINECADPAVVSDMQTALADLVSDDGNWHHIEGNSPAHVKASIMGASVTVPISDGVARLGTWQGIFLCEFDGPRTREVWVQVLS